MSEAPTSNTEAVSPNPTVELAKAEKGKQMFTDSVANRIAYVLGGKINTIRPVEPLREHFGRIIHEIDTDQFRAVLEDRDEFNRADGEDIPIVTFNQKGPTHNMQASIGKDGHLQVYVIRNPSK